MSLGVFMPKDYAKYSSLKKRNSHNHFSKLLLVLIFGVILAILSSMFYQFSKHGWQIFKLREKKAVVLKKINEQKLEAEVDSNENTPQFDFYKTLPKLKVIGNQKN